MTINLNEKDEAIHRLNVEQKNMKNQFQEEITEYKQIIEEQKHRLSYNEQKWRNKLNAKSEEYE